MHGVRPASAFELKAFDPLDSARPVLVLPDPPPQRARPACSRRSVGLGDVATMSGPVFLGVSLFLVAAWCGELVCECIFRVLPL